MKRRLECLASLTSLFAVFLVSEQILVQGWFLNGVGDILWMLWGYTTKAWWLFMLSTCFLIIAINGFINAL